MIYIFLGSPGTGKGTIASHLVDNYSFKHISTGNLFREVIKSGSKTGLKVKATINGGHLVDDKLTLEVLKEGLEGIDLINDNVILDGYPRNINQAKTLDKFLKTKKLKIDGVINFVVDEKIIIDRLSGRLICPKCSRTYHEIFNKPKVTNICDLHDVELIKRPDDEKSKVLIRLKSYNLVTKPLIDYYKDENLLFNLNAEQEIEKIIVDIKQILK